MPNLSETKLERKPRVAVYNTVMRNFMQFIMSLCFE